VAADLPLQSPCIATRQGKAELTQREAGGENFWTGSFTEADRTKIELAAADTIGGGIRRQLSTVVRSVPVDQLVRAAEIAQRFGLKRASPVHDWRHRYPEFPLPVATLSAGLVWAWPDVVAWARETGREIVGK
jgi:hypothetical protein